MFKAVNDRVQICYVSSGTEYRYDFQLFRRKEDSEWQQDEFMRFRKNSQEEKNEDHIMQTWQGMRYQPNQEDAFITDFT